jgi:RNA polymerase sigma-70 factor (ECF subfamily)
VLKQNYTDEELMALLKGHQSHLALAELHKRYAQKLLGFCIKMTNRDVALSQDIVQDVFLRILEKNHLFDPTKKFNTWVFTITSNLCKTSFRSQYRTTSLQKDHEGIAFSDNQVEKNEFLQALEKSINNLDEFQKETYILRFMEQCSLQEIAEITNTNLGTVKSRLFYAGKKIATELESFDPKFETEIFKLS